jgi:uncharacterized protein YecE (DUF72 family)
MADGNLLIGTAGWSYPDWEGAVYPTRCSSADKLRVVADCLDCVEVNSSFYRPPTARMTANWAQATAGRPGFRFLAKAWQRFTHERATPWLPAEFALFADGFAPLREAGRLDAMLFQFPWSFRNESRSRDWLARIADSFTGWPVAVELRHDSWATETTTALFRQHGFTYCNVDQPALTHCIGSTAITTGATGYFRLHGRNAKNWFREKEEVYGARYDHLYAANELEELLRQMRRVAAKTARTFVVFNNHKDGQAFANALELKARTHLDTTVRAPSALLARFPHLCGTVAVMDGEQLRLV